MNTQFPINKHYSSVALWAVCGKLLICLNAGVCMSALESHGGLSAYPYAAHTTPPTLPRAFTPPPSLSLLPPWLSSQQHAPAETDVWLDAIDKTTVWDGLPSQHAQLARPSAVNHLDRGWPLEEANTQYLTSRFPQIHTSSCLCIIFLLLLILLVLSGLSHCNSD